METFLFSNRAKKMMALKTGICWLFIILASGLQPSIAQTLPPQIRIDFETPPLGENPSQLIDPYVDAATGVIFTAESGTAAVGIVKNSAAGSCVAPSDNNQKLGTGTTQPGRSSIPIRATFPQAAGPVIVSVEFQSMTGRSVRLRLFDVLDNELASVTEVVPRGTDRACGSIFSPSFPFSTGRRTVSVLSAQPVSYAIMDITPFATLPELFGGFVIDNFVVEDANIQPNIPDIIPTALEVTQGIQNLANQVPLIDGKTTFARLYVRHDLKGVKSNNITARLRLTRNNQPPIDLKPINPENPRGASVPTNPGGAITVSLDGGNRANTDDAFLFFIPPEFRSGTVAFEAQVLPPPGTDRVESNNALPSQNFTFIPGMSFCVSLVPLHLHPKTYTVNEPSLGPILQRMLKVYPVSENNVQFLRGSTVYPYIHFIGNEWSLPDDFDELEVLARLWEYNLFTNNRSSCKRTFYYGMAHEESAGFGGAGGYGWDESWGTMISRNTRFFGPAGGAIMAHEIGHSFDLDHINCPPGKVKDPDNSYPFPPCSIGEGTPEGFFGFDVDTQAPIAPFSAGDMMSYAFQIGLPLWISAPTYLRLLGLPPQPAAERVPPLIANAQQSEFLAVSGFINTDADSAVLLNTFRLNEPKESLLATSGQQRDGELYDIVLLDETGNTLRTHTFSPDESPDNTSPFVHFGEILPYDSRSKQVVLKRSNKDLASRTVSPHDPEVRVLSPNGGEVWGKEARIMWEGKDADADTLRYTVQYSSDSGQTWSPIALDVAGQSLELNTDELIGSRQALIRVIASDGVNTGEDTSDGTFTVPTKAASVSIASPMDKTTYPQGDPVLLKGYVFDWEGSQPQHNSLSWHSDRDGLIGNGREVLTQNLTIGEHHITLKSTDSDGNSATAQIQITIVSREEAVQSADLELTQFADNESVTVGEAVTVTTRLVNNGPATATGIAVRGVAVANFPLDAITIDQLTTTAGSFEPKTGLWTIDSLGSGGEAYLFIVGRSSRPGTFTDTLEVMSGNQSDPDSSPGNGVDTEDDISSLTIEVLSSIDQTVSNFILVNAVTDEDLGELNDGDVIDISVFPTAKLNIRANTSPGTIGSVVFELSGKQTRKHTENTAPYALFANDKQDYFAWTPASGEYTLTATPYNAAKGGGLAGNPLTVRFEVISEVVDSDGDSVPGNAQSIQELSHSKNGTGREELNLQLYPNPFNSSTLISFTLAQESPVELTIYDLNGRVVTQLLDKALPAGLHDVTWQPKRLPAGVYIVRLKTVDSVETDRLVFYNR